MQHVNDGQATVRQDRTVARVNTRPVGATVMGLIGFVLATPLAAVVLVLTRFYRMDILGDPEAQPMEEEAEDSS
ncbi:MAG: hypothetical protein M3497_07225 [Gemmatimonadota bacterium]|nr:hypothetical protein [Gemmatimonadota bacterium]